MRTPIRTALIGFGLHGRVFAAPFLGASESYALRTIVTANAGQVTSALSRHPGVRIVPSVSRLLARADHDLVVIATPPATHAALAAAALDAGLHAVVDTPFVLDPADGEALLARARSSGRLLTVYQNRRWDSDHLTVRRLVEEGTLGEVREFEAHLDWWRPSGVTSWNAEGAGTHGLDMLTDLGSDLIDQALQLFGPVTAVSASAGAATPARIDDSGRIRLLHASGVRSLLTMDALPTMPVPRFRVRGTAGTYEKWGLDPQAAHIEAGIAPNHPEFGRESREEWGRLITRGDVRAVEPERGCYGEFWRLLALAVAGTGPLPVDPRDALTVARIVSRVGGRR